MKFEEYLTSKKIDSAKFKKESPEQFEDWKEVFNQIHPESFTQQKLFLINKIRRAYLLTENPQEQQISTKKAMRPKIPIKPKTS